MRSAASPSGKNGASRSQLRLLGSAPTYAPFYAAASSPASLHNRAVQASMEFRNSPSAPTAPDTLRKRSPLTGCFSNPLFPRPANPRPAHGTRCPISHASCPMPHAPRPTPHALPGLQPPPSPCLFSPPSSQSTLPHWASRAAGWLGCPRQLCATQTQTDTDADTETETVHLSSQLPSLCRPPVPQTSSSPNTVGRGIPIGPAWSRQTRPGIHPNCASSAGTHGPALTPSHSEARPTSVAPLFDNPVTPSARCNHRAVAATARLPQDHHCRKTAL
jgi:hypothetical protein